MTKSGGPEGKSQNSESESYRYFIGIAVLLLLIGQLLTYRELTAHESAIVLIVKRHADIQEKLSLELQKLSSDRQSDGILGSYLQDIRHDGLIPHAVRKKKIDELAANTQTILALLSFMPETKEPGAFKNSADEFQKYAAIWLDRKNSLMDFYLLGGNYPPGEPQTPKLFTESVKNLE